MAMHNKTVSATFVGVFGLVLYVTYPTWSNLLFPAPVVFTQDQWRETHKFRRAAMAKDFLVRQPYIGMKPASSPLSPSMAKKGRILSRLPRTEVRMAGYAS